MDLLMIITGLFLFVPPLIRISYYYHLWKFIGSTEKSKSLLNTSKLTILPSVIGSLLQIAIGEKIDHELSNSLKSKYNIDHEKSIVFNLGWIRLICVILSVVWYILNSRNVNAYVDNSDKVAIVFILFSLFSIIRWFNGIKVWIILFNLNQNIIDNDGEGVGKISNYRQFKFLPFIPLIIILLVIVSLLFSIYLEGTTVSEIR